MDDIEILSENESDFAGADPAEKVKDLKDKLKACLNERGEYLDGWQRSRAEFANYKTDEGKRREDGMALAREKFAMDILPVLDSFDMAFGNREAWEKVDKNWRVGVEYIYNQLLAAFEKNGITAIGKTGDDFDPNLHQSVETVPTDEEKKDHTVDKIIQKGYKMSDRIIRPARVTVFQYKSN